MDEGMSHIRIRLPPRVVPEDHLASAILLGLLIVHVKGFTPLCLTWAMLLGDGFVVTLLRLPPEV